MPQNTFLATEIEATRKAIAANKAEGNRLEGKLQGLLIADNFIQPKGGSTKEQENSKKPAPTPKPKTGNPPVGDMILQVLGEATKRTPYSEVCKKVSELAPNPVSVKTVSSALNTLKTQGKVDHNQEGYLLPGADLV